jgi:hypothetical protein
MSGLPYLLPETDDRVDADSDERYALYTIRKGQRRRVAETDQDGLGCCIVTLHMEGDITDLDSFGILDRHQRTWIDNPFAGP